MAQTYEIAASIRDLEAYAQRTLGKDFDARTRLYLCHLYEQPAYKGEEFPDRIITGLSTDHEREVEADSDLPDH